MNLWRIVQKGHFEQQWEEEGGEEEMDEYEEETNNKYMRVWQYNCLYHNYLKHFSNSLSLIQTTQCMTWH